VAAFAGATAVLALGAAATLALPSASTPLTPYMAPALELRADREVRSNPGSAVASSRRVTRLAPATAAAWLRIAYAETLPGGRLGAEGLHALARSYEVAPLGPEVTAWRIVFAFEHWSQLSPALRARAVEELRVYIDGRPDRARRIRIIHPTGRLAAALTIASIQSKEKVGAPAYR
jgi:hypothetical protein